MKISSKYIWDYDTEKLDLTNRVVLRWYLSRMVNCGQWNNIDARLLKENIDELDINPTLKIMLNTYYADKKSKNCS